MHPAARAFPAEADKGSITAHRTQGGPVRGTRSAKVAQSVEHAPEKRGVPSSILGLGTMSTPGACARRFHIDVQFIGCPRRE